MREVRVEGFTTSIRKTVDLSLVIGLYGPQGSGKTRFAATAPDPIGVIPLDRKCRYTIAKTMEELNKVVVMPEADFIRHENPMKISVMSVDQAKAYYKEHVQRVMEAAYRLLNNKDIRTIILDSTSQLFEDILFKHYGRNQRVMPRDRGPANQDFIDMINSLSGKHLILPHRASEVWIGDGDNAKPSGKYKAAGFANIGYFTTVMLEMKKNVLYNSQNGGGGGKNWKWSCDVVDCQSNPELEGPQGKDLLTDSEITFNNLAMNVYPDMAGEFMTE